MGLIQVAKTAIQGNLADQWKEYFYCDALERDTIVVKGQKRTDKKSHNTKGTDNIISNGSGIAVADGQCMIIVEQGKIAEICAEPGLFTYNNTVAPSVFTGNLGKSVIDTFKNIGHRFQYGGTPGVDQRVYYFNTKEIIDNKFGTPTPIPFRIVDNNINLDIDVSIRCSGVYSYKVTDPILFYTNVCGNIESEYTTAEIASQLKTEFVSALQPAFSKISDLQIRPNEIPRHTEELAELMNDTLSSKWGELRGLDVISIGLNPIALSDEDADLIKMAQRSAIMRDPTMAAATLTAAQADAMVAAAGNEGGGAIAGFMGMGMAQGAGNNTQNLFAMGQQQQQAAAPVAPAQAAPSANAWTCSCGAVNENPFCGECGGKKPAPEPPKASWNCTCGQANTEKFCQECGSQKPAEALGWTCACGAVNKGKFCPECGGKKPEGEPTYICDKCGWEPEDTKNPPKFCPECGDIFDDNDKK